MSKAPERKESRKGLIAFTREVVKWGKHSEETEPGHFVLKASDPREMIRSLMGALKKIADETITTAGKDPAQWARIKRESDHADPAYVAARLRDDLWSIHNAVNAVARAKDIEAAQQNAYDALQNALAACFTYHALAIVQNESGIEPWIKSSSHGKRGSDAKRAKYQERNIHMAHRFLEELPGTRLSELQLKKKIGRKGNWKPDSNKPDEWRADGTGAGNPLGETASIEAIDKGLLALRKWPL